MQIFKELKAEGGSFRLNVKVMFGAQELALIKRFGFLNYRIKTSDGPFVGKDALSINLKGAYRALLGKVKNRWSTALVRTTGIILLDIILLTCSLIGKLLYGLFKLIFGTRKTLSSAIKGITITSRRIEKIKEAEFFIFVSLAAIAKAIDYARQLDQEKFYTEEDFFQYNEGLDFAGAGTQIESDFEGISTIMELSKANA